MGAPLPTIDSNLLMRNDEKIGPQSIERSSLKNVLDVRTVSRNNFDPFNIDRPNTSFQRTLTRGGFGPLNSDR